MLGKQEMVSLQSNGSPLGLSSYVRPTIGSVYKSKRTTSSQILSVLTERQHAEQNNKKNRNRKFLESKMISEHA